jgi:hypothetical protein
VGKGYAEGPAAEERFEALERGDGIRLEADQPPRQAIFGSTADDQEKHFIGWADEVDPDALFTSGKAWGITLRRVTS